MTRNSRVVFILQKILFHFYWLTFVALTTQDLRSSAHQPTIKTWDPLTFPPFAASSQNSINTTTANQLTTSTYEGNCEIFSDAPWKCTAILGVRSFISIVSLCACLTVIVTVWLFKKYKIFSQRMLLYLAVAAALDSLFRLGELISGEFACRFIALLKTVSLWWVLLIILIITVNLLFNLYNKDTEEYEWFYMSACWSLPVFYAMIPLFKHKYGQAGVWCWIVHDTAWRFAIWYGPLFILVIVITSIYAFIILKKKSLIEQWPRTYDPEEDRKKDLMKLQIASLVKYPIIFLCLHTFPIAYRIYDAAVPNTPQYALMFIAAICIAVQGGANSIAFFTEKETRNLLTLRSFRNAWHARTTQQPVAQVYTVDNSSDPTDAGNTENPDVVIIGTETLNLEIQQGEADTSV